MYAVEVVFMKELISRAIQHEKSPSYNCQSHDDYRNWCLCYRRHVEVLSGSRKNARSDQSWRARRRKSSSSVPRPVEI